MRESYGKQVDNLFYIDVKYLSVRAGLIHRLLSGWREQSKAAPGTWMGFTEERYDA